MNKSTRELAAMAQGQLHGPDVVTDGAAIDSRQVRPGQLYIPIIGARADGHSFLEQARQNGAAAALWQKDHTPWPEDFPLILVDDTIKAMGRMARARLQELDPYVIGVTGSNGKTSAKDMLQAVLETTFRTQSTPGNRNSEIGLPLTIFDFEEGIQAAILEMGMENAGEIRTLVEIAPLDAAVITSIGSAHLENLGSKENIAKTKLEIAEGLKPGAKLYYTAESEELKKLVPDSLPALAFGPEAQNIRIENGRMHMDVAGIPYDLNTLGAFQCHNALPAIHIAESLGVPTKKIQEALARLHLTGMRMDLQPAGNGHILDDSYKSNPESAMAALSLLAQLPGTHAAALGDMLDLGPEEEALHRQVLEHAQNLGIETYTTGPVFEKIGHNWKETKEQLADCLTPLLAAGATILVKGSRALQMDQLIPLLKKEGNSHE